MQEEKLNRLWWSMLLRLESTVNISEIEKKVLLKIQELGPDGASTVDECELARALEMEEKDVKGIMSSLENKGLIRKEKPLKQISDAEPYGCEYKITELGVEALEEDC